jgi:ABC-type glycerol-3-phosphate transport system substrate-binding protein
MRRFVLLLLLLSVLVACGGPAGPDTDIPTIDPGQTVEITPAPGPDNPSGDGPVTISYAAIEAERPAYEALAQKFMADNPNIKIVIVPLDDLTNIQNPNGQYNPLDTVRSVVSGADTARAGYVYLPPEALSSGLLMDIKPLMDADASFKREDFYPGAIEQYTIGDQVMLLPRYLNVQILTYNKELFKQANLPEPKPDWTWTDLLGRAEQIGKRNGGSGDTYGFFDTSGGFLTLIVMLQNQGIDLINLPAKDVRLDRPEIVAAIKRLREMLKSGAIYSPSYKGIGRPIDPGTPGEDPQQIIRDGRIGIWGDDFIAVDYGPQGPQQAEPLPYATGKAPYPAGSDFLRGGGFSGDGYFISSGTQYPNQAWKWIEFLSRQPIDTSGSNGPRPGLNVPGRIPARESLAEQTSFWKDIDADTATAYKWTIAHPAKPLQHMPDYTAFGALSQAIYQLNSDDKADPAKVLADAQRDLEKQLADAQLMPTPTPDTSPVLVATPEPQEAPAGATTITFDVNGYNPTDIRRVARAFRDQHPEIFVKIKSTQTFTEPLTIEKTAKTSDCFTWFSPPQGEPEYKALLDLQPLFDADAAFPRDDYPPALLTPYRNGSGLFGLPYAVNLRTLNYNKTAFDAAGIKAPIADWKPSDFLSAAQALTKGEGDKKQYGYVALNGAQADILFFIGQFGTRLTKGSGDDTRPNFDDPKLATALQWYIDLAKVHKVMPEFKISYRTNEPGFEDKSWEYAQSGRAGMWFGQGAMFGSGDGPAPVKDRSGGPQQPSFEEGIAALPIGGAGLSSGDFYIRGFHISATTQQAQACWEWLKFLSADASPNNLQGGIPARTSIAQSDAFVKQAPAGQVAIYKAYADALKHEGRPGDDPNALYGRMDLYWFYQAIDETITKDADLGQGLTEAQKTTTAFLDCLDKSGKPPKSATCAKQVDTTYQGYNTEDPKDGPPGFVTREAVPVAP